MPPIRREREFEIRYDDYVHFVCVACNASAKVTYLGTDPSIPKINVKCPKCHKDLDWKIFDAHQFPRHPA